MEQILAASPAFAGPGTRPYRIVLLALSGPGFSVHRVYLDVEGGKDDGFYSNNYAVAMRKWVEKCQYEIEHRGEQCWLFAQSERKQP